MSSLDSSDQFILNELKGKGNKNAIPRTAFEQALNKKEGDCDGKKDKHWFILRYKYTLAWYYLFCPCYISLEPAIGEHTHSCKVAHCGLEIDLR